MRSRCDGYGFDSEYMEWGMIFTQATYEKVMSEVPKYKMITPSILADRLRVRTFILYSVIMDTREIHV